MEELYEFLDNNKPERFKQLRVFKIPVLYNGTRYWAHYNNGQWSTVPCTSDVAPMLTFRKMPEIPDTGFQDEYNESVDFTQDTDDISDDFEELDEKPRRGKKEKPAKKERPAKKEKPVKERPVKERPVKEQRGKRPVPVPVPVEEYINDNNEDDYEDDIYGAFEDEKEKRVKPSSSKYSMLDKKGKPRRHVGRLISALIAASPLTGMLTVNEQPVKLLNFDLVKQGTAGIVLFSIGVILGIFLLIQILNFVSIQIAISNEEEDSYIKSYKGMKLWNAFAWIGLIITIIVIILVSFGIIV